MKRLRGSRRRWSWPAFLLGLLGVAALAGLRGGASLSTHAFAGRCLECHQTFPRPGTPYEEIALTDTPDRLCGRCHQLSERTSHPIGVIPKAPIPLQRYLDHEGRVTCITCHDVHKGEREGVSPEDAKGLLRGHVRGKAFCAICHQDAALGAHWRHQAGLSFAHASGELTPSAGGAPLDSFSMECLSCHDGGISKSGDLTMQAGVFRHGVTGPSHPVGVDYPRGSRGAGYVDPGELPDGVRLFEGRIGCLSCHSPFSARPGLLVRDMTGSDLCLACHRK